MDEVIHLLYTPAPTPLFDLFTGTVPQIIKTDDVVSVDATTQRKKRAAE